MTDNDKVEGGKVVKLPESHIKRDVEAYHPLSQALRVKKSTPPSDLNEARVPVLTNQLNVQPLFTETQSKKANTILDDIAAINKLFGE